MNLPRANKPGSDKSTPFTRKRQQGVAIITALLIVTIAATVSITISTRLQIDVRRTSNLIALDQADFYLLEAEEWSQRILREDKKNSTIDTLDEDWAIEIPPLPVDGGSIQGKLTDLQACISVNSLVNGATVNAVIEDRLNQLFNNLGIKVNLTQAITDWIDPDLDTKNPDGAEDSYYMNLEKPYRTANTPLNSISELRLIKGFEDSSIYDLVKPHLCAFIPVGNDIPINVNTASTEVLQSLSAGMTATVVENILQQRKDTPFNSANDFTSFSKINPIITNIDVSSDYFLLETQAKIGQANKIMYSIIYRDAAGETKIISRTQRTL
jgi:general secretion pathway protein K